MNHICYYIIIKQVILTTEFPKSKDFKPIYKGF